ncbi:sigma-70 family RNA polymerase sigma factor [Pseudonocardia lutea]|jgi:RNA polymerase sigma-B factor|uniref:Sigma-70 family RNA polymerase sigma factor n=1 Tax=Pseudonocardia lutea TaxID=2172015 RepID=A0ABW1IA20_9PSEU
MTVVAPLPVADTRPGSLHTAQLPRLRTLHALAPDDPRRRALRNSIAEAYLPIAERMARGQAAGSPTAFDDLLQVARLALLTAIDRWDPERGDGTDFVGYLVPCIRGEFLHHFRDQTWVVRVPRRVKEMAARVNRESSALHQRLGRAPRPSEVAGALGVDREVVLEVLLAQGYQTAGSLDERRDPGEPEDARLGDLDADLGRAEDRATLRPLLAALPERERTILGLRFVDQLTQSEIARRVGVSQMHVSRLLARSLATLRAHVAANHV